MWFHPLPIYPIVFQYPRLPVGKHSVCNHGSQQTNWDRYRRFLPEPTKHRHPSKKLFDQRHIKCKKNNLQCVRPVAFHCQLRSFLLCVLDLASHMSAESEEEGQEKTTLSNTLNLDCSTHSTSSCLYDVRRKLWWEVKNTERAVERAKQNTGHELEVQNKDL